MDEEIVVNDVVEDTPELDLEGSDTPTEDTTEEIIDEEFNPDSLFSDEDGEEEINYTFGSYDLSKFKDVLDFEDQDMVNEFAEYASKYEEKGFTQEQVEFILEEKIAELDKREQEKSKKPTQKEIKERLQNSLTKEEIRNYKPTSIFVKDLVKGTEFEDKAMDILQNPTLVKLFHTAYKKSLGKTTDINKVRKPKETQIKTMSFEDAQRELMSTITSKGDKKAKAKELMSKVNNREMFSQLLSTVGIEY